MCNIARRCGEKYFRSSDVEKCTPLWRKAHSEEKMLNNCSCPRSTFRRSDVATLHAAVAKSTFGSENVKKCGPRTLFHVRTPLWRKDLEVKMQKNGVLGALFTGWMWSQAHLATLHAAVAKSTFRSKNVAKLLSSEHFSKVGCRKHFSQVGCRKIARSCGDKHSNIARRCGEKHHSEVKM